jgi:predicted transcriptional regulator
MVNLQSVRSSAKLLSTLSKRDSLSIFMASSQGLKAESDTPHMLGLTKKTYYTRLKQLIDAGLITKSDGAYCYTTFGNLHLCSKPFWFDIYNPTKTLIAGLLHQLKIQFCLF